MLVGRQDEHLRGTGARWLIVALTLLISWEVFSRYVLSNPHAWAFDVMLMCYGRCS
jgi:TRAP-type C4-dicarboxylate transport system permease small subunit